MAVQGLLFSAEPELESGHTRDLYLFGCYGA